jgi:hypothetical protein
MVRKGTEACVGRTDGDGYHSSGQHVFEDEIYDAKNDEDLRITLDSIKAIIPNIIIKCDNLLDSWNKGSSQEFRHMEFTSICESDLSSTRKMYGSTSKNDLRDRSNSRCWCQVVPVSVFSTHSTTYINIILI